VKDRHYCERQWPLRGETILGQKNVAHRALVDKMKICLPPLHLKLVLIKIFVKVLNKEREGFDYLRQKFPCISKGKIKESIFVSPQVKRLFQDPDFKNKFNAAEKRTCDTSENVRRNILGNKNQETKYKSCYELRSSYRTLVCNM